MRMNNFPTSTSQSPQTPKRSPHPSCTLHVCTSCRKPGTPREPKESRPGFVLYEKLRKAFQLSSLNHRVDVVPAKCLSICPRPCGIALSSPGSWTYLFGDQQADQEIDDIVDCVSLYIETSNGFMERHKRPKSLRSSILGRVPPIEETPKCI